MPLNRTFTVICRVFFSWFLGDKDCGNDRRRPPVPKATDHIATPYRTRRNFVHKNALDAMLSEPPNAAGGKDSSDSNDAYYVDSPRGNTQVIVCALNGSNITIFGNISSIRYSKCKCFWIPESDTIIGNAFFSLTSRSQHD